MVRVNTEEWFNYKRTGPVYAFDGHILYVPSNATPAPQKGYKEEISAKDGTNYKIIIGLTETLPNKDKGIPPQFYNVLFKKVDFHQPIRINIC